MKRQHLSCLGHFSPFQYGGQYKPNQSFRLSQVNHVICHVKQYAVVTQRSSGNLSLVLLRSSARFIKRGKTWRKGSLLEIIVAVFNSSLKLVVLRNPSTLATWKFFRCRNGSFRSGISSRKGKNIHSN